MPLPLGMGRMSKGGRSMNRVMRNIEKILKELEKTGVVRKIRCYSTWHGTLPEGEYIVISPIEGEKIYIESTPSRTVLVRDGTEFDINSFLIDLWYYPSSPSDLNKIIEHLVSLEVELPEAMIDEENEKCEKESCPGHNI